MTETRSPLSTVYTCTTSWRSFPSKSVQFQPIKLELYLRVHCRLRVLT